jgi:hypothetical protein
MGSKSWNTKTDLDSATLNGLDDEMEVDFVIETVHTLSSLYANRTALKPKPKVAAKLERVGKHRSDSLTEPPPTVFTGAVAVKRTRGRPKNQPCDSHIAALLLSPRTRQVRREKEEGRRSSVPALLWQHNGLMSFQTRWLRRGNEEDRRRCEAHPCQRRYLPSPARLPGQRNEED